MKQLILCLSLLALPLWAQDRAGISGTVTDPTGALVAGAKVEIESTATGFRRTVMTGDSGLYEVAPLGVGVYSVHISKTGFKPVTVNGIDLQYGETRTIGARLEVGATSDAIEVAATVEALNRTNAEVGAVIEHEQIKEIPVSGRDWASLMLLSPGCRQLRRRQPAPGPFLRPFAG